MERLFVNPEGVAIKFTWEPDTFFHLFPGERPLEFAGNPKLVRCKVRRILTDVPSYCLSLPCRTTL